MVSGNLSFAAAGGANTPGFLAVKVNINSNCISRYVQLKSINSDTESFDTDNAFDTSINYTGTKWKSMLELFIASQE